MSHLAFRDIDQAARGGATYLLEATDLSLHAGRWSGGRWVYSSGQPIDRQIARYATRASS